MRRNFARQDGVTLIELIVAMTIMLVVVTAAVSLLTMSIRTNLENRVVQELQREADAVQANMSQNLKSAVSVDPAASNFTADPHALQVNLATSGQSRRYYVTGQQLYYRDETNVDTNLLSPGTTVVSFQLTPTSDPGNNLVAVHIRGTLQRTRYGMTKRLDLGTTIRTRPQ